MTLVKKASIKLISKRSKTPVSKFAYRNSSHLNQLKNKLKQKQQPIEQKVIHHA